ncbi:MAG: hypothetical protein EXQ53_00350 [Acidobacteria bacterium]|nr:hypothetical protein [Acidobacteriota bacterium]
MEVSKSAVGILAALCIALGAGGAYLAIRSGEPAQVAAGTEPPVARPDPLASNAEHSAAQPPAATPSPARQVATRRPVAPRERRPEAARRPLEPAPEFDNRLLATPDVETPSAAPPAVEPVGPAEPDLIRAAEPAAPEFEELVVSADSVIGLQVESS